MLSSRRGDYAYVILNYCKGIITKLLIALRCSMIFNYDVYQIPAHFFWSHFFLPISILTGEKQKQIW